MTSSSETPACAARQLVRADASFGQPAERLGQRLARDALLALVAPPAAHAVVGLGDIGELEVQPEGAQHGRRALVVERAHAGRERRLVGRRSRCPGLAGEPPHALDVGQQLLAVLLDEHAAERIADQADVAPQRVVAAAALARGGVVGAGARHRRSLFAPGVPSDRASGA